MMAVERVMVVLVCNEVDVADVDAIVVFKMLVIMPDAAAGPNLSDQQTCDNVFVPDSCCSASKFLNMKN